jgi:hypothetical protein
MNMEQMSGGENEKVELGNQMQEMLAERHGEQMMDFIDNHAEEFRKYVNENDDVLDAFKRNPEEAIKAIEPLLYH